MGAGKRTQPLFTARHKANREELDQPGVRIHHPSGQERHGPIPIGDLRDTLQSRALELGFVRVGIVDLDPERPLTFPRASQLEQWLARGLAGDMSSYLSMPDQDRSQPGNLMPGARSLVVVALPYLPGVDEETTLGGANTPLSGLIARYARGSDYHHTLKDRLLYLADILADLTMTPVMVRTLVDTGPLMERDAAELAGLGFIGKNSMLIAPGQGSGVLLGSMVTSVDLTLPEPRPNPMLPLFERGCGTCRACLTACPTDAFVEEYVLDARRCISYLTIELIGAIPRELRSAMGMRVFGCDTCQNVCPFNHTRRAQPSAPELAPKAVWQTRELTDLRFLGSAQYRALIAGTALRRTFRVQLSRNAAIALGNSGDASAIEPLFRAATTHPFELVRAHAAWALGELGTRHSHGAALARLSELAASPVESVRDEVALWRQHGAAGPKL